MPKRKKNRAAPAGPVESQAAEAATIGWMLSVLTLTFCELGVVAAWLYYHWRPDIAFAGMVGELLLFASAIVGLVALLLIPVVYKSRRIKPPTVVTAYTVAAGIVPWLILVVQILKP